ncbi:MAG TPA: amidohydrolase family protein [Terracidiphilus sp.]|nr:amidohydrolase family protein [Terracidiphilus sp.]
MTSNCTKLSRFGCAIALVLLAGTLNACSRRETAEQADLLITNGYVYTLTWGEPGTDGTPAPDAPHTAAGWKGDAQAIATRGDKIVFVGSNQEVLRHRGPATRVIDARGATVIPGLVDSHVHIVELGRALERVNLVGVPSEAEAVERVAERAAHTPKGEWIVGYGWDDGAWADHYPDMDLLSRKVPDHPVYLRGLHGYAVWGNRPAFEKAGISASTKSPDGGEIRKGRDGKPTGILLNRAVSLLESAVPPATPEQLDARILAALQAMAAGGYVAVEEAGADTATMASFERLASAGKLPIRMNAMVEGRDEALTRTWLAKGPDRSTERMLTVECVKFFYDGALGSRGALMLADYSDQKGHRGVGGAAYRFNKDLAMQSMKAGFQIAVHAIGDAANRETLDLFEQVIATQPETKSLRHRIEHAQVLDPADIPRFAKLGIIASMQPSHAVEDKGWAEDRVGPERVKYAYAWRSLRRAGATMVFNSDLPGTDYNIFYGLHSAMTRQGKDHLPAGGWHPEQRMTAEEALRGFTNWAAYVAFWEKQTGTLAPGKWADITIMDLDPLTIGETDPGKLLNGSIAMTIVAGKVVYEKKN